METAKKLKADDTLTLAMLGDIYMNELKDPQKALDNYEAYVRAGGTDPDVPTYIDKLKKELAK